MATVKSINNSSEGNEITLETGQLASGSNTSGKEQGWSIGSILINEYKIEKILGYGGMGTVYLARSLALPNQLFAVKTLLKSLCSDSERVQSFVRELRTWMNLPDHPNLVHCYFFKTIGDRFSIFSEYISGGSLRKWIKEGKISDSSQLLDIAIQIAWGIHAAHSAGVVHLDIKPANILMTRDGSAKITDFGLSKTIQTHSLTGPIPDSEKADISVIGCTPAYCSPEHFSGEALSFKTDMWSWAVTILEMITGRIMWRYGVQARQALQNWMLRASGSPVPDSMCHVLLKCFEEKPSDRWQDMDELALKLQEIWGHETGRPYPRNMPMIPVSVSSEVKIFPRNNPYGVLWKSPEYWFSIARMRLVYDIQAEHVTSEQPQPSAKAQALADLEHYQTVESIWAESGYPDAFLADFYGNKANLLLAMHDIPGAEKACCESISIFNKLSESGETESYRSFVIQMGNLANIYFYANNFAKAVETCHESIEMMLRNSAVLCNSEDLNCLARQYSNQSAALVELQQYSEAVEAVNESIRLRQMLVEDQGHTEYAKDLASSLAYKAGVLIRCDRARESIPYFDEAIRVKQHHEIPGSLSVWRINLAMVLQNKAIALRNLKENESALQVFDDAIGFLEQSRQDISGDEFDKLLAIVYINKSNLLRKLLKLENAAAFVEKAISMLNHLIERKGRTEELRYLAKAFAKLADYRILLGQAAAAEVAVRKSLGYYRRLIFEQNHWELVSSMTRTLLLIPSILSQLEATSDLRKDALETARVVLQACPSEIDSKVTRELAAIIEQIEMA